MQCLSIVFHDNVNCGATNVTTKLIDTVFVSRSFICCNSLFYVLNINIVIVKNDASHSN